MFAAALWSAAVLGTVAWFIGRLFTDDHLWTQYLFWIPSLATVLGCSMCLVLAFLLRVIGHRIASAERRHNASTRRTRPARGLYRAAAALIAIMLAHSTLVEWRMLASGPQARLGSDGSNAWRLSYWNVSGSERGPWVSNVLAADPDLVIIANAWGYKSFLEFRETFKGGKGPTNSVFFDLRFMVATRWPLLRWGSTDLRLPASDEARKLGQDRFFRVDPGRAAFLELDVSEHPAMKRLGRPLVVWVLDLPSDISVHRPLVTSNAMSAIASLGAAPMAYREGEWLPTSDRVPFPPPDVIVGDFNIPRGSGSLRTIAVNAVDAFDAAGAGYSGTFPAQRDVALQALSRTPGQPSIVARGLAWLIGRPWWKIDHAFVNPPCRVTGYRVLDPGSGTHRLQMLDLRGPEVVGK